MMNYNSDLFSEKIKKMLIDREKAFLSPYAQLSSSSKGRALHPIDDKGDFRLCYQRDRDRITHSKPFRRLKGKTQVFLSPIGDHYRTRLTHTLEVSQISRTIARSLCLNEDLTESIALGHDLGHTPFGHFGESALNEIVPGGFHHAKQSEKIAKKMNLTLEVCEGIARHSKGKGPILDDELSRYSTTLEGQIVRVADIIAYINHDMDDAKRAGILKIDEVPVDIIKALGRTPKEMISTMVSDVIINTFDKMENKFNGFTKRLYMSSDIMYSMKELRGFLFDNVYEEKSIISDFNKVREICSSLFKFFIENPDRLIDNMGIKAMYDSVENMVLDYISGMTDNYATVLYKEVFLPKSWGVK